MPEAGHNRRMDEIVKQAMAKWPNVPACYGWLGLDRRGDWYLRDDAVQALGAFASGAPGAKGSRLEHQKLIDFIQRNYQADADGCWFFQNGPQQVFVSLDYTPLILRLASAEQLETHTGLAANTVTAAWLDEDGSLLLGCEHGVALLDDRDLAALCARLEGDLETQDAPLTLNWAGSPVPVGRIAQAEVAARFGFVSEPSL